MKIRLHHLILFALLFVVSTTAQSEIITNADIVRLLDAGLSPQFIIRKLNQSATHFDVSTSALIELKKRGLAEEVILAMIERHESQTTTATAVSDSSPAATDVDPQPAMPKSSREMLSSARTIAFVKSSAHPSRQALEKELMKRPDFRATQLTITRYKDKADLYVEIGYVSLSWLTHRYVYRIYDRQSGRVLAAGETTSWGSLAENLARNISRSLIGIG